MKKDTYKSNYFIVTVFEKKQEIQYHTVILQPMKEPYRMAYICIYQFSKIFLFHVKKRMTAYFSNAIIFSKYGKTLESVIFFAGGIVLRSDIEMMNTIINIAESDDRILAAYLKGSRTNPKVPKDIYRDFDVMYVVTETESFIQNTKWLNGFGEIVLKQEQDDDFGYGERFGIRNHYDESYSWLLLFKDGNRIDIGVEVLSTMQKGTNRNKLFVPLIDKIGCLPQLPPPTDEDFYVKRPTEKKFRGCCNEFYWCLCDVAKGIARDELPFAMTTYNTLVRNMLEQMLDWYIGFNMDYSVSCGKLNKYLKKYLPEELYNAYLKTYTDGNYDHFWCAIDEACKLFRKTALLVGEYFHFVYPENDESAAREYMEKIRTKQM